MDIPTELTIGERVARARIARGISQQAFAGLVGRSSSWVSKVERGAIPLDRNSVLLRIAGALDVEPGALKGSGQIPQVPSVTGDKDIVRDLRRSLMYWSAPVTSKPVLSSRTIDELRRDVGRANRLRQDAGFRKLGGILPQILDDLHALAIHAPTETDRRSINVLAAEALHDARAMTKKLGHLDLAWMTAELAGQAARQADDPLLIAANAWNYVEVYKAAGAPGPAQDLIQSQLDSLAGGLKSASPAHLSLWGTMHLQAALIAAYWSDRASAAKHLNEADAAAVRLGADANHYDTMFGPTNVAIHRVAIGVELGEPGSAVQAVAGLDTSNVGRERRARLGIDLARAHRHAHQHDKTLQALLAAERIAPDYVRPHPMVREIVGAELRRIKPELRALAQRIGVL
jgi:transcriptional regulator with XRE-family HTH domain